MFKSIIKKLREKSNLSQNQLGNLIGVSQSTIGMWESGKREPSLATFKKIAKYFNVSTDYLIGVTDDPIPLYKKEEPVQDLGLSEWYNEFLNKRGIIKNGEDPDKINLSAESAELLDVLTKNHTGHPPVPISIMLLELIQIVSHLSVKSQVQILAFAYEVEENAKKEKREKSEENKNKK